jgi:hypothetical protein
MPFRAQVCTVVYVDPSAVGANNGTTPADALIAFPLLTALVANRVYLVRRSATISMTPATCAVDNIAIMGMPLPTDEYYAAVPAEAKSAWDADVQTAPTVNVSQASTTVTFSGHHVAFHRLTIVNSCSAVITVWGFTFSGVSVSLSNVTYRGVEDLATLSSATAASR